MWSGAIVDIPHGYVICDGNNGTPDLRNQFVVGAGDTYDPDDSAGALTHIHSFTGTGHTHTLSPVGGIQTNGAGLTAETDSGNATGLTNSQNHLPPYYSLAYIMKT